jgi:hypothetical protein
MDVSISVHGITGTIPNKDRPLEITRKVHLGYAGTRKFLMYGHNGLCPLPTTQKETIEAGTRWARTREMYGT